MDYVEKLRQIRVLNKLSQLKFAEILGIGQMVYSNLERNVTGTVSIKVIENAKKHFGENIFDDINTDYKIDEKLTIVSEPMVAYKSDKDLLIQSQAEVIKIKDELITMLREKIIMLENELGGYKSKARSA